MIKKLSGLFLFIVLLHSGFAVQAAGLEDADERLFKVQHSMAQKGNTRAQYYLGEMHEHGLGTEPNLNEAFKWYAKAAEQGDPLAKRKLSQRQEIFNDAKKEQEEAKLKKSIPEAKPAAKAPASSSKKASAPASQAVAKSDQAAEQADLEKRRAAAAREQRRAKVRAMIREYTKNPTSTDPFE